MNFESNFLFTTALLICYNKFVGYPKKACDSFVSLFIRRRKNLVTAKKRIASLSKIRPVLHQRRSHSNHFIHDLPGAFNLQAVGFLLDFLGFIGALEFHFKSQVYLPLCRQRAHRHAKDGWVLFGLYSPVYLVDCCIDRAWSRYKWVSGTDSDHADQPVHRVSLPTVLCVRKKSGHRKVIWQISFWLV